MLVWSDSQFIGKNSCPFCYNILPTYLAKIFPETLIMHPEKLRKSVTSASPVKQRGFKPAQPENGNSPFVLEFFLVQGAGFRCMAYRNDDGKWRGAFNHEELPGAVRVLE
jgi:hypothetical protein